jgi:hypothetical protein
MTDTSYVVTAFNNNPMGALDSGTSLRCGGLIYEVSRSTSAYRSQSFAYVGSSNTGFAEDMGILYFAFFR